MSHSISFHSQFLEAHVNAFSHIFQCHLRRLSLEPPFSLYRIKVNKGKSSTAWDLHLVCPPKYCPLRSLGVPSSVYNDIVLVWQFSPSSYPQMPSGLGLTPLSAFKSCKCHWIGIDLCKYMTRVRRFLYSVSPLLIHSHPFRASRVKKEGLSGIFNPFPSGHGTV